MRKFIWIVSLCLSISIVAAQSDICSELIEEAFSQTNDFCADTGSNEACYGSSNIVAEGRDSANFVFGSPGDVVGINEISSIETLPLDTSTSEFGIAMMRLQVEMENTLPGQLVTILLLGQTSLESENESMTAFTYSTGIGASQCDEIAYDSLVIDSPDGATIEFNINGVDIELGSTAVLVSERDGGLHVYLVEGEGEITSMGETETVPAGQKTWIELDGLEAVATPKEAADYPTSALDYIPFELLSAGQNVALGKTATASQSLLDFPTSMALDGIPNGETWWGSGGYAPQWFEVDLGKPYAVEEIRLFPDQYPFTVHSVHVLSVAGADHQMTVVQRFEGETTDEVPIIFTPDSPLQNVQFVRIDTLESESWVSWLEVEVISAGFVPPED